MKIVIAADSYKGSATTFEVAGYIEQGIRRVHPDAAILKIPLADGGEGTVDALVSACGGRYIEQEVTGPLGSKVNAKFGLLPGDTAVVEMAAASGLPLIKEEERNPFITTTFGTGQLIKAALNEGVKTIYVGIGGSATNDGGLGMAQALGVSFKDKFGREIGFGAKALEQLDTIDISGLDVRLKDTEVLVLSDVTNPLCGDNGASYVYGPQKGASPGDLVKLDWLLRLFAEKIEQQLGVSIMDVPGAGAAGGLGAGLMAFCQAEISSGIETVLKLIGLEENLKDADLVITGEGRMDFQSTQGKAPVGVAKLAKKFGLPVIAIVGSEGEAIQDVYDHGIDLVIDIINRPLSLQEAMDQVGELTAHAGEKAIRAFQLNKK
ncbi:glycerate kinase [Paenibacillus yonginensis]|uniref:Glycerate kinase n=1 Tax=Paenibacillus yonginensis TaxID=1462996 RepID=A0A1B1N1H5_9BACL|nr:glycerate kinase [Paenibacillus yonginensis]